MNISFGVICMNLNEDNYRNWFRNIVSIFSRIEDYDCDGENNEQKQWKT